MIATWLSTQPERVRAVLDPSWSPVQAAVVLAARHEQEAIASLEAFFTPDPKHNPSFWSDEFLGNLVPARCFADDMGVVPAWRAEQLSCELLNLRLERETLLAAMGPLGTPPLPNDPRLP